MELKFIFELEILNFLVFMQETRYIISIDLHQSKSVTIGSAQNKSCLALFSPCFSAPIIPVEPVA